MHWIYSLKAGNNWWPFVNSATLPVKTACWEIFEKTVVSSGNKILPKLNITNIMVSHTDMSLGSHSSRVSKKKYCPTNAVSAQALKRQTDRRADNWHNHSANISLSYRGKYKSHSSNKYKKTKSSDTMLYYKPVAKLKCADCYHIIRRHVDISAIRIWCSCSCLVANLKCHTWP